VVGHSRGLKRSPKIPFSVLIRAFASSLFEKKRKNFRIHYLIVCLRPGLIQYLYVSERICAYNQKRALYSTLDEHPTSRGTHHLARIHPGREMDLIIFRPMASTSTLCASVPVLPLDVESVAHLAYQFRRREGLLKNFVPLTLILSAITVSFV
jgi:hypothetical protein